MCMFIISGGCPDIMFDVDGVAELLCDSAIFPEYCPEGFERFSVVRKTADDGGPDVFVVTIGIGERLIPVGSTIDECAAAVRSATEVL
jgi:hypothetical protein